MSMVLVNLLFSYGAWASWPPADDSFEGQVKLIAEDAGDVKVKLSDARGEQEIFRFCNDGSSSDKNSARKEKIQLIHEAMRTGRQLRVRYPGRFENCVEPSEMVSIQ